MSAFLCNPDHIGTLAANAARLDGRAGVDPQMLAEAWACANLTSVAREYSIDPDAAAVKFAGRITAEHYIAACVAASFGAPYLEPMEVYKLAEVLDYQCWERPDWTEAKAARWLAEVRRVVLGLLETDHETLTGSAAYDALPWSYQAPEVNHA